MADNEDEFPAIALVSSNDGDQLAMGAASKAGVLLSCETSAAGYPLGQLYYPAKAAAKAEIAPELVPMLTATEKTDESVGAHGAGAAKIETLGRDSMGWRLHFLKR